MLDNNNFKDHILVDVPEEWSNYDAIICNPIFVNKVKKIKMLKRGIKSILKKPEIFFNEKKQTVEFHFDMHHGHGNLEKAIKLLNQKDRDDFHDYVKKNTKFNPHIMYISKTNILNDWFKSLFTWLEKCELIFDKNKLVNYDTSRLFAYLAERYSSFWFKKYTNFKEQPWIFIDPEN